MFAAVMAEMDEKTGARISLCRNRLQKTSRVRDTRYYSVDSRIDLTARAYIPYTFLAFSLAISITLVASHPSPNIPATKSAVQGIIAVWHSGRRPFMPESTL